MSKLNKGSSFISKEVRKNFTSFYLFGDNSSTKRDLIGNNNLTIVGGNTKTFYGRNGLGEKFEGDKYFVNRSISPTITGFPLFLYVDVQDDGDISLDNEILSLSPWITNYTKQYEIFRGGLGTYRIGAVMTDGSYSSYSNNSKPVLSRAYTASLVMRSITDFTLFVNGEKLTPFQTLANGFSNKNSIVVGANSNGSSKFVGGIFSFGWGIIDPGDDFLRRLTMNPTSVIFQKSYIPMKSVPVLSTKQRRTLSSIGTRIGKRQGHP